MKKRGSAIILAVLLLAFFTAIALAVFYLGQKKGERAYLKVIGEEVSNEIDMGSTLAYYEAYMAEQFVRKGKVYSEDNPYRHSSTDVYPGFMTANSGDDYMGIRISNYINFFASNWNFTNGGNKLPSIENEVINTNTPVYRLAYRQWAEEEEKIKRIWLFDGEWDEDDQQAFAIGGYRLEKLEARQLTATEITDNANVDYIIQNGEGVLDPVYPSDPPVSGETIYDKLKAKTAGQMDTDDAWYLKTTYTKRIRLSDDVVGQADFKIQAVHKAVVRFEGGVFDDLKVDDGELIEELIIEKM